ncbi:hypothetical protein [Streptomyces sp. NBC_00076]|uniref:hypothetical protein n=1 Tax=Streptomyces sp. NBC_00076 TaxID=2975642 RepID=UPI003255FF6D
MSTAPGAAQRVIVLLRDQHPELSPRIQETSEIAVDLKILTARRMDLSADLTRAINRLRSQMLEYFPALERAFDYSESKTALILLTGYETPAALRRIGRARLATWLKNHGVRVTNHARTAAEAAVTAAEAQSTAVPGEKNAAKMVHALAREVMALDEEVTQLNALIEGRSSTCPGKGLNRRRDGAFSCGGVRNPSAISRIRRGPSGPDP